MDYAWPDKKTIIEILRKNFFLKPYSIQPSTLQLLKDIYPNTDWNRVDFYEGLPWFTPLAAPFVSAQALPQFYSFSRYRIYLKKFDESRAQCIADIVHEGFHVMQAMSYGKGYGFGFFRIWMILYLADFFRNGYRQNVFEIPAFDQEFRFLAWCEKNKIHGISPALNSEVFNQVKNERTMIFNCSSWPKRINGFYLLFSTLLCLLIAIAKAPIDLLMGIFALFVRRREDHISEK